MDVGLEFAHYRVIEHIGRGGMADVWSARDQSLNRTVAVKTVSRDLSHDVNPLKLFEREAQTIANLEHPHILPIYEFGEYDQQLYIVMRYVSGGSLEDLLEEGPLPPPEVMRLARAVAQALDYAHESKVVHLDLKPSNILLDSYQLPYLADFGLAAAIGPEGRAANPGSGTLLYMAPEQLTAEVLDHRADIYSFSIMLFHMMTGQLPFDATVPLALKQIQMNDQMPSVELLQPNLPAAITVILRQGTAIEVAKRPATLTEMVEAIEDALGAPVRAGGRRPTSAPSQASRGTPIRPEDLVTRTESLDDLITGPADNLITRSAPSSGEINNILSGSLDDLISTPGTGRKLDPETTRIEAVEGLPTLMDASPEAMARHEAVDIYTRAYRTWLHGQGRFLLGITHFMLINDYYVNAEQHGLEIDQSGMEMMLRGALEYDHDVDTWWERLDDDARRLVALHALLSESAPARVRALQRLERLPDAEPPQIPRLVAQQLQVETNAPAQFAALRVLEVRGKPMPTATVNDGAPLSMSAMLSTTRSRVTFTAPQDWREVVYTPDIDGLLAEMALDPDTPPDVAEYAARVIGRIRSETAVKLLAERQQQGERHALHALALVRDEAPSLPASVVSRQVRLYTWFNNTWRRVSDNPMNAVSRYLIAAFFAAIAVWWYAYSEISSAAIFFAERWGKSLTTGITFGVVFGVVVLLGAEIPERLRGFWLWWARLLLSAALGFLSGVLVWIVFAWFFLYYQPAPEDFNAIILGGIGTAAAFALGSVFDIPGWITAIWAAVSLYIPLYVTWANFMPPLIYTRPIQIVNEVTFGLPPFVYHLQFATRMLEPIQWYAIPIVILIAVGAYLPSLIRDARGLWRRAMQSRATTKPVSVPEQITPPPPEPVAIEG